MERANGRSVDERASAVSFTSAENLLEAFKNPSHRVRQELGRGKGSRGLRTVGSLAVVEAPVDGCGFPVRNGVCGSTPLDRRRPASHPLRLRSRPFLPTIVVTHWISP